MSRIRTIKPEYFLDEGIADLSLFARLSFPGLWTQVDREGKVEDGHRRLKSQILPYDKVDFDKILEELRVAGFITRYSINGKNYIMVNNFLKHQRPHVRESESSISDPPPNNPPGREGKGMENGDRTTKVVPKHNLGDARSLPYAEIIGDLNKKAGTKYRSTTPKTQGLIKTRFGEGFTLEDFKTVHTKKCKEWLGGEYAKFLRPETLYGTKFEGYLNQTILPPIKEVSRYDLEVKEAERREAVIKRQKKEQEEYWKERDENARRIQQEKAKVEAYWNRLDTLEQKMIEGEADLRTRTGFGDREVSDESAEFRLVFMANRHLIIKEKMEEK